MVTNWKTGVFLALTVMASAGVAQAEDVCATFFWSGSNRELVERYKPKYLIGQGLEDVGMDDIVGTRIRYKWSQQAASCFTSSNSYGYFSHVDFGQTSCSETESCFPGTRFKRFSERLTDVRDVVLQLDTPNPDATYQDSLNRAKSSSFLVIDAMANAATSTASFLTGLASDYESIIDKLDLVLSIALPASLRTSVLDELCSPANVAQLENLNTQCFDNNAYCDLRFLFDAINDCKQYQNGAVLDALIAQLTTTRDGLVQERAAIAAEASAMTALWTEIQDHR